MDALCFSEVGFQGVFVLVFGDIMGDFYGLVLTAEVRRQRFWGNPVCSAGRAQGIAPTLIWC